jgi:recombination protein RecT
MTAATARQEHPSTPPPPTAAGVVRTIHGPQQGQAPENPVTTALRTHRTMLEAVIPKSLSIEAVLWEAFFAAQKNPDLLKCTPLSLVQATSRCLQLGFVIGITGHLVPFYNSDKKVHECIHIPDYKGIIELIIRHKIAQGVEGRCVYKGEPFKLRQGLEPVLEHEPVWSAQKPENLLGAYVILRFDSLRVQPRFEFLPIARIEQVRRKSKSWSQGACPDWYAIKTVVKYLAKFLPTNGRAREMQEILDVVDEDNRAEFGEAEFAEPNDGRSRVVEMNQEAEGQPAEPLYGGREAPPEPEGDGLKPLTLEMANAIMYGGKTLGERTDARLIEARDFARRRCDQGKGDEDQYAELATACTMILEARAKDQGGANG